VVATETTMALAANEDLSEEKEDAVATTEAIARSEAATQEVIEEAIEAVVITIVGATTIVGAQTTIVGAETVEATVEVGTEEATVVTEEATVEVTRTEIDLMVLLPEEETEEATEETVEAETTDKRTTAHQQEKAP
jgi:hypothetical protein